MSPWLNWDAAFAGVGFRTSHPEYDPGAELEAYVTGADGDDALVRIGDTVIRLAVDGDAPPRALVDRRVRLRVTEFDDDRHVGRGELLEDLGDV